MSSPIAPDQLVRDYLAAVDRALVGLPGERRRTVLDDLRERIAAEHTASGATMPAVLDRLGDPDSVAAEIWRREAQQPEAQQFGAQQFGAQQPALTTPTHAWPAIISPTLDAPIVAAVDGPTARHRSGAFLWASVTVAVVVLVLIGVVVFALLA
ncbi:HAAS signaling domain-containing protein [Rugosimonospora africana]|uniref:Uncharacterized protein n=1 Tax=Rugosimonospora africana TaxID=556532 RepID=A0A8J3QXI7_9ACTN|nr:hypothetical protein [Rugosimonospora africana]GIH16506.1 hypothetical protein Raf01_46780 [Rugosimonospora africana]